jgi:hypothetical protein
MEVRQKQYTRISDTHDNEVDYVWLNNLIFNFVSKQISGSGKNIMHTPEI